MSERLVARVVSPWNRARRSLTSHAEYQLLFERNPNPMWVYDAETLEFLAVNDSAVRHYGYSRDEFLGMTLREIRPPEDAIRVVDAAAGRDLSDSWRHLTASGELIDVHVTAGDVEFEGRPARLVLAHDVTEQRRSSATVERSERRYRDLFENAAMPIATADLDGMLTEVNEAFAALLGYTPEAMAGTPLAQYLAEEEREVIDAQRQRKLTGAAPTTRYEQTFIAADGTEIVVDVETRLVYEEGVAVGTQGVCRDITEHKQATVALQHLAAENLWLATHDPLTELPNRRLFAEDLEKHFADATEGAVLLISVERLHDVSLTFGPERADALIRQIAWELRRRLRADDRLARFGNERFAVLVAANARGGDALCEATLHRINEVFSEPFVIQGVPLQADAVVGIARYMRDGTDAETLLGNADLALERARRTAASHAYHRPEGAHSGSSRLELLAALGDSLDADEIVVEYQPQVDLATGRLEQVEALARWQHPSRGLIGPGEFVEAAEQTALIGPLTLYVVENALEQLREWDADGLSIGVAVNLSGRNLVEEFPDELGGVLDRYRDCRDRLVLEITESALIEDPARARRVLEQLRDLDVRLSLDDFGRGYTSLAFLSEAPLQQLKIDRSFVTDLDANRDHRAIVRATVNLGHDMGLEVVAEGIETAGCEYILEELGCDVGQGFHYSPALCPEALLGWARRHRQPLAVVA
jgi:PAS domain S-box-containing protein/diguanylate cyclase (GGDEF)-like protein